MTEEKDDVYFYSIIETPPTKKKAHKLLVQGLVKNIKYYKLENDCDLRATLEHLLDKWLTKFCNFYFFESEELHNMVSEAIEKCS